MPDASRLVAAMVKAGKPKENSIVDLVIGTVVSVSPLKIKIGKLTLTETFLTVGALCKEARTPEPELLLWRGLQNGDEVYMIRLSSGQKYYVLQRKEGIV